MKFCGIAAIFVDMTDLINVYDGNWLCDVWHTAAHPVRSVCETITYT